MGTQQLLLTVLGMVLVGIAITVGITLFQSNAIESGRNALIEDMLFFAGKAREYYWRPYVLGGGGRNFKGVTIRTLTTQPENDNGRYYLDGEPSEHELVLMGVGRMISGNDTIRVPNAC